MKCFFCKHQLNLFEERCPNCGKAFDDSMTKEEALDVLRKNKVVLNQGFVEKKRPILSRIQRFWIFNELNK